MHRLICLFAGLGLSAVAFAQDSGYYDRYPVASRGPGNVHYAHGEVLDVRPVQRTTRYPGNEPVCYDAPVQYYHEGRPRSPAGTLVGAIIGGVVGSQFGSGDGRRAATAAGTLIGASAGYDASRRDGYVSRGYEQRCEVRRNWETVQEVVGYDVTYRYRGEIYQTRTDRHPGDSIRVRVAVDAMP